MALRTVSVEKRCHLGRYWNDSIVGRVDGRRSGSRRQGHKSGDEGGTHRGCGG